MKRHAKSYARERVIRQLYTYSVGNRLKIELCHYDQSERPDKLANMMIDEVLANLDQIDSLIKPHLKKWSFEEMNYVNLAILRTAIYELKFTDTPAQIIVNEALNFANKYTDYKSKNFINFVLDNVSRELHGQRQ
ncbi:MAG: transcription antitermination factor NusB [Mycoplasmatales bacterium]